MKNNHFDAPSNETTEEFAIEHDAKAYGNGPLKVSIPDYQLPDIKTIHHSWDNVDIPHPQEGFLEPISHYWSPNSIDKATATRSTARTAYYDPIVSRKDFKLMTETHVDEITFSKDRAGVLTATGVKYTPKVPTSKPKFSQPKKSFSPLEVYSHHTYSCTLVLAPKMYSRPLVSL